MTGLTMNGSNGANVHEAKKLKSSADNALAFKSINTLRVLSAEMVQAANSGHPGMPMGMSPVAYLLFTQHMRFNPVNPGFINRDRFVLSNGHGCALLYSMLHLTGYARPTMEDLKAFRQFGSVCAGHPENTMLAGVEVTTGPLGQGVSNAVGMAIAQKHLAAVFNRPNEGYSVIDNFTYVFCGDGCLQEGISSEACSLAGHLKLGKLIVIYDDNNITIDGSTGLSFTEDVSKRYEAYDWQVITVENGDEDLEAISNALTAARENDRQPTMIRLKTKIGFGSSKAGHADAHGSPLGDKEIEAVKTRFGMDPKKKFFVDEDVKAHMHECVTRGSQIEHAWKVMFQEYSEKFPDLAKELTRRMKGELPANWESSFPVWNEKSGSTASRNTSGKVLNALAKVIPDLMGGSADLTPSTKTWLDCSHEFQANTPDGRYIRFGVREHAMAAISNGMAAYGGVIPFCATFLNFASYALGAIRLSAMSHFRVIYIMTHDSIGLGEDGPTHQPMEVMACLRAIPELLFFRPADANEVSGAYQAALLNPAHPSVFALTRQDIPLLTGSKASEVFRGAYILESDENPRVILCGTGSEVCILVEAAKHLRASGNAVSVVSMPCLELFDRQSIDYKLSVFPAGVPILSMEAGSTRGWHKYAHCPMGIDEFGKSAPFKQLYEYYGITTTKVVENASKLIAHYKHNDAPCLVASPWNH